MRGCSSSTPTSRRSRGHALRGDYEVAPRALVVLRQPLDPTAAREAAGAPARVIKKEAQRRRRRAGVVIPLFSIRSASGWGLGEIPDLARFATWAGRAGFSVLQLLPVNARRGVDPSPYAAISAFALDPVYLSLDACEDFVAAGGRDALADGGGRSLEAADRARAGRLARRARAQERRPSSSPSGASCATSGGSQSVRARQLAAFMQEHATGSDDYALFAVLHEQDGQELARLAGAACAIATRARSRPPRRTHEDALLRAHVAAVAARSRSGAARGARRARPASS